VRALLAAAKVEYRVVDGLAVLHHGAPRPRPGSVEPAGGRRGGPGGADHPQALGGPSSGSGRHRRADQEIGPRQLPAPRGRPAPELRPKLAELRRDAEDEADFEP
jgi:hypothetical protein